MPDSYIEQLRSIGFQFHDKRKTGHSRIKLEHYIPTIGTARFHDYAYPFIEHINNGTQVGTDNIIRLYRFDRKLRLLTLDAIERIEVCIKSHLENALIDQFGHNWHANERLLDGFAKDLFRNIKSEIDRTQLMRRMKRNGKKYEDFPSGRVLDNVSYGRVEILLGNISPDRLSKISEKFKTKNRILLSWVKSTRDIRNTAAHHSRLWNKKISAKPIIPHSLTDKVGQTSAGFEQSFYAHAIVMQAMVRKIGRNSQWKLRLRKLIEENNIKHIALKEVMGFPYDWWETDFWK